MRIIIRDRKLKWWILFQLIKKVLKKIKDKLKQHSKSKGENIR